MPQYSSLFPSIGSLQSEANTVRQISDEQVHTRYQIGFDLGDKRPIHENVAIAAFIRSSAPFAWDTNYENLSPDQWEYFRGLIWNDDPSCLLFNDEKNDNRSFGAGIEFGKEFKFGDSRCMTKRSHFGDLQFLHAMGQKEKESPQDTRERLMKWIGVMYKLACGNQGVAEKDQLSKHFPDLFDSSTDPMGANKLRDLLLATTAKYQDRRIPLRALGSCLHIIQDSYAIGHVQRRLRNPQDMLGRNKQGVLNFKLGTWSQWGAIVRFHTYAGQNSNKHDLYDGPLDDQVPDPRNLDSFNRLHGARDAITASTAFINAVIKKRPWEDVRAELEKTTFALDPAAKECNKDVDGEIVTESEQCTEKIYQDDVDEVMWREGLAYKLSNIEGGLSLGRTSRLSCAQKALQRIFCVLIAGLCTMLLIKMLWH